MDCRSLLAVYLEYVCHTVCGVSQVRLSSGRALWCMGNHQSVAAGHQCLHAACRHVRCRRIAELNVRAEVKCA